jgi:hypothetical protein
MTGSSRMEKHETQSTDRTTSALDHNDREGCCGGPAPKDTDACCVRDADMKIAGAAGCGCAPRTAPGARATRRCC